MLHYCPLRTYWLQRLWEIFVKPAEKTEYDLGPFVDTCRAELLWRTLALVHTICLSLVSFLRRILSVAFSEDTHDKYVPCIARSNVPSVWSICAEVHKMFSNCYVEKKLSQIRHKRKCSRLNTVDFSCFHVAVSHKVESFRLRIESKNKRATNTHT